MWIIFNRRWSWFSFLHMHPFIYYLSCYSFCFVFQFFLFHAGLALSWTSNELWFGEWNCLLMFCGIFCKYTIFSEMGVLIIIQPCIHIYFRRVWQLGWDFMVFFLVHFVACYLLWILSVGLWKDRTRIARNRIELELSFLFFFFSFPGFNRISASSYFDYTAVSGRLRKKWIV